ncbi:MAG: NADAR family protein [Victivallales bacterium]
MKNSKLSPAEQIVAELADIGFWDANNDFTTKLRMAEWDDAQFAAFMEKLKILAPFFEQLPDAVKLLLDLYIQLPCQMLGYIEHSAEAEQKVRYESYFDMLSVMGDIYGGAGIDGVDEKIAQWRCRLSGRTEYYSLPWLLERIRRGELVDYLFFWGHQPSPDGGITASCLSQWWPCDFSDRWIYNSAEQYMMVRKAEVFQDYEILRQIRVETDPQRIKKLGRQVHNFDPVVWDKVKFHHVIAGNDLKFSQNRDLGDFLLSTGNAVLVEASPCDCVWGIGMGKDDPDSRNPEKWRGKNLLGFALMEVRDKLRRNHNFTRAPDGRAE